MRRIVTLCAALLLCCGVSAQQLALSTNVLDYVNCGTLNVAASYGVSRHWSLEASLKYNPFTYGSGEDAVQIRQQAYSTGARYWPWYIYSGWWFSGGIRYQEYNAGGYQSPRTSEGDRIGGCLGGGYTYMLSSHLNLDLGIRAWAGYDIYTTYACQSCGRIVAEGRKFFVLPSDILLALTFLF